MKGIDVSRYQGKIDWQRVKAAGIEFSIIRAGYGMYENQIDPRFAANMAGAKAAGIPVGVYWYSYAVSPDEARREAEVCLKALEPYRAQIVLPVALDFEDKCQNGLTADESAAICAKFLAAVGAAGYRPMLYSFSSWLQTRLRADSLKSYPRWVAHTGVTAPVCSEPYLVWQYDHHGRVDGISGEVDLNEGYDGLFSASAKDGWVYDGPDVYLYENGQPVKNRWVEDGGWQYRLGPDGKMQTGLVEVDGKGYYLNQERGTVGGIYVPWGACIMTDTSGKIIKP